MQSRALQMETQLSQTKAEVTRIRREKDEVRIAVSVTPPDNVPARLFQLNLLRVNDQNLVLWAIDENMGTNLQAFYKHFYIGCLKTHFVKIKNKFFFFFF